MDRSLAETVAQDRSFFNIIDGKPADALSGQRLDVVCPSDGRTFATIPQSSADDVDAAVRSARNAFESTPWGRMAAVDRGRLLLRLSELILENKDELAALESRDTGKPIRQGVADIVGCARYFEFYGSAADKIHGTTLPIPGAYLALTLREPHGVVAGIIPWNYPAQIMGRVAGAGLAMGNTLVLKPAEDACLSVIRVAELALEAGIPGGVFNVVTGLGAEAGAALSSHRGVDFVTFTGSPATGTAIQQAAAVNNRGVTMELGGKSPQIVFADANLDKALPVVVNAIIQNGGQTCSAGSRVLIEASIYDEFTSALGAEFQKLKAGPHYADLDLGALINRSQYDRVQGFLERAGSDGIEVLAEGMVSETAPSDGFYTKPTLYGGVPTQSTLARDEVFGPVLSAFRFEGEDEAVRIANDTEYGLVAGIWTANGSRQMRMAKRVRAGQIFVNAYGAGGGIELPFGGFKRSGHGREKGFEGLFHMSATKTVIFNHED
ncbi:MAG: aldehyde dehydrogenase family protein [Pseudomonadota bacterium]